MIRASHDRICIVRALRRALLISAGVTLALTTATVQAQESTDTEPTLQEVIVTGSYIPRTDSETPSAVQVMSAQQIQQSGYTNISEVLRNISANGANTLSQSFGQAFAAGASGVSLRGLTVGDTLVLIDGHRTVDYPLADDNQRSFVDISAIPFNAIERIEVLKDGASAVYGADAIGGVVNVILRKTYTGAEFTAEAGTSEKNDGTVVHLAGIGGFGDLASDGYNAYLAVDFHHTDEILASNRHGQFTTLDWTPYGGVNTTLGASNDPNVAYPSSITGYLINPNTTTGTPYAYLPGCSAALAAANHCTYTLPQMQLQPPTEQVNILGKFTKALPNDWKAVVQGSVFTSDSEQINSNYSPNTFNGGNTYPTGLYNPTFSPSQPAPVLVPFPPAVITVPANYPGNPFGVAAPLVYQFHELGQPQVDTETTTYRLVVDVSGKAAGWDLAASGGLMYSRMIYKLYGNLEYAQLQDALNNGYLVGENPSGGAASLFAPPQETEPTSSLSYLELHGSRPLFQLPGGPLSLAVGAQYFHKVQNETAPPDAISGVQAEAGGPIFVVGSQEDAAAFAEVDAAVLKQLELNAAVRYDHYDTYGSSTTPKFGVKFQPIDQLALRGTWGKGFRAPSPAEGQQSGETFGAGGYADPILCPNPNGPNGAQSPGNYPSQCAQFVTGYQVSNPHLKAVTSTEYTFGAIVEPIKSFNMSVDYYNIKLTNDIISAFEAGGLGNYTALFRGSPLTLPYVTPAGVTVNQLTPVGEILLASYPYENAGSTQTSGIDVDLRSFVDFAAVGRFTGTLSYTHEITYAETFGGVTYELAGTHGPSGISGDTGNPKDRAVFTLGWDRGPIDITATVNFTGSFSITDPSAGQPTCLDALNLNGTTAYGSRFSLASVPNQSFCSVHSFTDVDLYGRYALTQHFAVHASILNLFNRQPPIDLATYGGGGELAYDPAFAQIGAVGRFFTIGATYKL
jgi:iron complex outermembrane receptor protein